MPKKFYDIFPPNIRKEEKKIKEIEEKDSIKGAITKNKSSSRLKGIFIFLAVFFLGLGAFLYFKLPRAELEIWPNTEPITLAAEITIDKNASDIDIINKVIPGKIFEEEKEIWQDFPATGNVVEEEKAKGTIRVFNKHSPASPVSLRAATRFLSDSGKYFISSKSIYIPANSSVDIEVVAVESGEDYNIGAANFSVPGLVGTAYYYTVYGAASAPMQGGFKKESKQVTEDDIKRAENDLTEKVLGDVETLLRNKISSEYVLLDNAVLREVVESTALVKAGAIMPKFNFQIKGKAKALVFDKSDLESFAKKIILSEISNSRELFEESLKINYRSQLVDMREERATLNLEIFAKVYPSIDKEIIFGLAKGRNEEEIQNSILGGFSDKISQVRINLWPFWVKKAPNNINKIKVKLNLD